MEQSISKQTFPCSSKSSPVFRDESPDESANRDTLLSQLALPAVRSRSRFVVNVLSNAGGNSLNSVLQLLLLLALGRLLGTGVWADWFAAGSIIAIGEVASDFGTRLWAVKRFAGNGDVALTFRYCVWHKLIFTLLTACVFGLLPLDTLSFSTLVLSVLVATTQPSSDPFLWYLRGIERLDVEAGVVLSSRVAIVAALVSTAMFPIELSALLAVWLTFNLVRLIWESRLSICTPLFANTSEATVTFPDVRKNVGDVLPIGVSLVLTPMFTQCALLLVKVQGTDSQITEFGTAFRLSLACGFVGTSIVVSSFARLSRSLANEDEGAAQKIIGTKFRLLTAALAPICILGMLLSVPVAEFVSRLTLKPDLAAAGQVMVLLMPGLYLSCINMGANFSLNAFGLNRQDVIAVLLGFATLVLMFQGATAVPLPIRGALCWTCGEFAALVCRLSILKAKGRLHGVPVWLITGTLTGLVMFAGILHLYGQG